MPPTEIEEMVLPRLHVFLQSLQRRMQSGELASIRYVEKRFWLAAGRLSNGGGTDGTDSTLVETEEEEEEEEESEGKERQGGKGGSRGGGGAARVEGGGG